MGNDVNVPLLDRIADVTRASTTYVLPEENVEVKVATVFKRLYGPVLSDISIETIDSSGSVSTQLARDLIPSKIPDIFEDDQLILLGQYTGDPVKFRMRGNCFGQQRVFDMEFDFDAATTRHAFVPRLWASRRIAYLVDQVRQAGAELAGRPIPRAPPSLMIRSTARSPTRSCASPPSSAFSPSTRRFLPPKAPISTTGAR